MLLKGLRVGFGFTGAYCVFDQVFPQLERVVAEGATVIPLVSYHTAVTNSRYGTAEEFLKRMKEITGNEVIKTIEDAELVNKQGEPLDVLVIAPATGSTLSKMADGDSDTPILMMAKEMFRNNRPVVLGIATNDGLGLSAKNIGILLSTKNVYFIPFGQDDPFGKPNSLVARFDLMVPTIVEALKKEQLQPVLEKH
ncbi:MAG: dipicolinate synthase subunit B [Firmicutes bacterium]|nr:dipicolinate synthase subunit B [Bacillota bacterium]